VAAISASCASAPVVGSPSAETSSRPTASTPIDSARAVPSATPPVDPPTSSLFVSFDDDVAQAPEGTLDGLVDVATKLSTAGEGARVELTGSSNPTGDLTIDRSKALRRGEALRNWFIERKVSGVRVVVKNPGPPCKPPSGKDELAQCRGVQVDVWLPAH
jgi:hypothetical protein